MFRVRIAPLADGLHTETLTPTADDLGLDAAVFSGVEVELTLDVREPRVHVSFVATATARLECDRTLELYDQPVKGRHRVVVVPAGDPLAEADSDDVIPMGADATHVDLADPVRDTLVLALPLRRVSPAAEALDLQTAYGGPAPDEPADDRWHALQALRAAADDADPPAGDGAAADASDDGGTDRG